jgi:hypothetical protein
MRIKVLPLLFSICAATCAAVPEPVSLAEAESRYLEAFDREGKPAAPPLTQVAPKHRLALRWLAEATTKEIPANPFRKNSSEWREAESLRRLLVLPPASWPEAIGTQTLTLKGSRMAFWRWGRAQARRGALSPALRHRWENQLLIGEGSDLLFQYAQRHALCFALAEGDEARFAFLKENYPGVFPELYMAFQRAFALLGSPSPAFSLWKLPELSRTDSSLGELGSRRIWMGADPGQDLPALEAGITWIVPTKDGLQPEALNDLIEPSLGEAHALASRLKAAGRTAYLAPVRKPFEIYALMYFPILLELDGEGLVRKIRMGEAALAKEP